jgi:hypothetical protein
LILALSPEERAVAELWMAGRFMTNDESVKLEMLPAEVRRHLKRLLIEPGSHLHRDLAAGHIAPAGDWRSDERDDCPHCPRTGLAREHADDQAT